MPSGRGSSRRKCLRPQKMQSPRQRQRAIAVGQSQRVSVLRAVVVSMDVRLPSADIV